jgi:hypothetical protein
VVGLGKNLWPSVDIHEREYSKLYCQPHCTDCALGVLLVGNLYIKLYDAIITNPATGHDHEGFYFGASDEHNLYEVSKEIAKTPLDMGKGKSAEPTTFTDEEVKKYFDVGQFLSAYLTETEVGMSPRTLYFVLSDPTRAAL